MYFLASLNVILILANISFLLLSKNGELFDKLSQLPAAWGAFLGAIVGLVGVAWSAERGRTNMLAAQNHRANIEAQARLEQNRFDRAKDIDKAIREAKFIGYALMGELTVLVDGIIERRKLLNAGMTRINKQVNQRVDMTVEVNRFHTAIFEKSIDKLGPIGPSIAGDLITIYTRSNSNQNNIVFEGVDTTEALAHLISSTIHLDELAEDVHHVHSRLAAFVNDKPDTGPLWVSKRYHEQREREFGPEMARVVREQYEAAMSNAKPSES